MHVNGGDILVVVLQICKRLEFIFLAKHLLPQDVSGIGVFLNKSILKEGIDWSIKNSMILFMSPITCTLNQGII